MEIDVGCIWFLAVNSFHCLKRYKPSALAFLFPILDGDSDPDSDSGFRVKAIGSPVNACFASSSYLLIF